MIGLPRLALTSALAGALAACGGSLVNYSYVSDNYHPYELSYSARKGGMLTEITGNPFPTDKAALDRTVTKNLEDSHFGPKLSFFTEPPGEYRSPYRVVVLFNPAPHANGSKLCSRTDRPQAEWGQEIKVLASYCSSDSRINTTAGSLAGATGPDDPAFQQLMRQVSLNLFPPAPNNRGDRDSAFF